ncbi:MAG: EAL domain-containing protein [Clostridia bacterium]|nr:EAL domain-containing protein [Clostridia bacterium]
MDHSFQDIERIPFRAGEAPAGGVHPAGLNAEELIHDFSAALKGGQFKVFFQPKFDLRQSEPVLSGAEALVRWHHPRFGLIGPAQFIRTFEENGLIRSLDTFVLDSAAWQIRDWKDRLGVAVPVSVNLSGADLFDPAFADRLIKTVGSSGIDRSELVLEIPEKVYSRDPGLTAAKVGDLRSYGFTVEVDDFLSGGSSMWMLSEMPADALKLDMRFVRSAFGERVDTRLIEAAARLAASFETPFVVKGAETAEQAAILKMIGCDQIQGYFFSKPVPASEFDRFLVEKKAAACEPPKKHRESFSYRALHDKLTGLYNNCAFDLLVSEVGSEHTALLIAEVAGFDGIRRDMGREYADELIVQAADYLRQNFRSVDYLFRLGEDRFAIIMGRVRANGKKAVVEKIRMICEELRDGAAGDMSVYLRAGIAFSDDYETEADICHDAETALEAQKKLGVTGCSVFGG